MTTDSELMVRLTVATADFDAAMRRVGEAVRRAMPSVRELGRLLGIMREEWPGMPYTAPSLWDAEQMRPAS